MKKQIVKFSPLQTAKVLGILYALISLPIALLMMLLGFGGGLSGSVFALVLIPVLYGVGTFVFTAIGSWAYNFVASKFGGIEFTTEEKNEA